MKILNKLSFHKKIFLACLLTALVPLLCSSVVMIRLFTAALDRQNLDEGRTQITKAEARLEAVFEKCEEACKTIATDIPFASAASTLDGLYLASENNGGKTLKLDDIIVEKIVEYADYPSGQHFAV